MDWSVFSYHLLRHDPKLDEWWRQVLWRLAYLPVIGTIFEFWAETWGL